MSKFLKHFNLLCSPVNLLCALHAFIKTMNKVLLRHDSLKVNVFIELPIDFNSIDFRTIKHVISNCSPHFYIL